MKIIFVIISLILIVIVYDNFFSHHLIQSPVIVKNIPTNSPTLIPDKLAEPIDEFKKRITKKSFGIYVTPQNSPVSPEKFNGFHTGIDIEYEDIFTDVNVFSIDDGKIIYSGYVNGYGGFIAIQYSKYIAIYGHLKPSSLIVNKSLVKKGEKIAILGQDHSIETDNERKHLHFAILNGSKLDFRGYVQKQSDLSFWQNPLDLFN